MKELYILTDVFPWGKGEKSFLLPEIPYLQKEFKVSILSRAPKKLLDQSKAELDKEIKVLRYQEPDLGRKEMLWYIPQALFSKELREELCLARKEKAGKESLKETYIFWIRAVKFHKWMNEIGVFESCENKLFYSYWANHGLVALSLEKKRNPLIKFVSRTHRYDLYNEAMPGGRQPFKGFVDQWIDKMIFIAKEGLDYYLENFATQDGESDKYVLRRLGVAQPTKFPPREEKEVFRLVSCSGVDKRKRVNMIPEALDGLDCKIEWHHFGDGPEMEELYRAVTKLDDKQNINYILHGHVSNGDILHFYENNWVDGFITTSSSEGSPVSIQEAMSYGIPVIGTSVGEIPLMIRDCGILLSENPTVEEISTAISKLCGMNQDECELLRCNAKKVWEENYRLDINATEFVNTLINV